MKLGPRYVYECPNCASLFQRGSVISGNSFGADIYSDGSMDKASLGNYPSFTCCRQCGHLFWVDVAKVVGAMSFDDVPMHVEGEDPESVKGYFRRKREKYAAEWYDSPRAEYLTLDNYYFAIHNKLYRTDKEEKYLRKLAWWMENFRDKSGVAAKRSSVELQRKVRNMRRLAQLLDESDSYFMQGLMKADIYRQLGEFDNCLLILNRLNLPDHRKFIAQMREQCEKGNKLVFCYKY